MLLLLIGLAAANAATPESIEAPFSKSENLRRD